MKTRLLKYIEEKDESFIINILENSIEFHKHFLLNEFFDKDIDLEKPEWDGKYFTTRFKIDDVLYTFKAMEDKPGLFGIQFFTLGSIGMQLKRDKKYAGSVFSGVRKGLELLIKHRNVNGFYFNTDEPKLIDMYDKLVKLIEKKSKFKLIKTDYYENRKMWVFEK